MTSPIETNNVVETVARAIAHVAGYDVSYTVCKKYALAALEASEHQSLSDRIDVLEGENARLRKAPAYGEATAGTATKLRTRTRASLTQGGKTNG